MMDRQICPVGPEPGVAEMLVGALVYSSAAEASAVLALVDDSDVCPPLSVVLAAVRQLAARSVPPSPQLILDELKRAGALTRQVATALMGATTTGATTAAAHNYAAAVVAESLRRRVESAGTALTGMAGTAAEVDLGPLVERAAASVRDCARRLQVLRGEQ
ncbi:hypothetical protein [Mycobacterium marinum]|uniref:hypothetical protein n=1 Tax=Mycobacterium marinum TaxID=1781 RepID=UPI0021C41895|nr:hypothetical protein [Mycobacterium marinum]GJO36588.1 hypothetical protein NJB1604_00130 [Mycobacterium marinum]